jgi:hypothetical protein
VTDLVSRTTAIFIVPQVHASPLPQASFYLSPFLPSFSFVSASVSATEAGRGRPTIWRYHPFGNDIPVAGSVIISSVVVSMSLSVVGALGIGRARVVDATTKRVMRSERCMMVDARGLG